MAMQRMAEQEREMAKIQEAAKQTYLQQQQGLYTMYLPYGYAAPPSGPGGMPAYPPGVQPGMMPPAMPGQVPLGMVGGQQQQPMGMLPPAAGQQQQPIGMLPSAVGQQQQQPMGAVAATAADGSGGAAVGSYNPVYAQQPPQQQPPPAMYYAGMMAGAGTLPTTAGNAAAAAPPPMPLPTAATVAAGQMTLPGAPYSMHGLAAALPQQLPPATDPAQKQQQHTAAAGGEDTTLISFDWEEKKIYRDLSFLFRGIMLGHIRAIIYTVLTINWDTDIFWPVYYTVLHYFFHWNGDF
jgi:hypothetical protein